MSSDRETQLKQTQNASQSQTVCAINVCPDFNFWSLKFIVSEIGSERHQRARGGGGKVRDWIRVRPSSLI